MDNTIAMRPSQVNMEISKNIASQQTAIRENTFISSKIILQQLQCQETDGFQATINTIKVNYRFIGCMTPPPGARIWQFLS
jgi:hypothetical protein